MENGNASALYDREENCHCARPQSDGVASPAVAAETIWSKAAVNIRQDHLAMLPHFVTAMHNHEEAYRPRAMSRNR
jgi:hypothetical protein